MAAVDWFGATAPAPLPVRRAPRSRPSRVPAAGASAARTPARSRSRAQGRKLTGGIVWIAAFALLLTGVVALNVAVLRLNMNVSKLDEQQLQLQAQNQALASQVSSARSAQRIEATARKLGLIPAPATDMNYLDLAAK
jgi:cell division protein FtsL